MSSTTKFVDERIKEKTEAETESVAIKIHYLPLKIEYNGKADVEQRFSASANVDEDQKAIETEFRGRPLKGNKLELPAGYKGIIMDTNSATLLNNSRSNGSENADKVLYVKKEFQDLIYWNWDRTPSGMDTPVKVMDWLQLASELHNSELPEINDSQH